MTTADTPTATLLYSPGGTLSYPGSGVRPARRGQWGRARRGQRTKVMTRSQAASVAALARWAKWRAAGGHPAKQTDEERQAKRDADRTKRQADQATARTANRAAALTKLGIDAGSQQALSDLEQGKQPDAASVARAGLEQAGLVERGRDGSYRLTATGRSTLHAADAGDAPRAGDAISASRDRIGARQDRQAASQAKRDAAQAKRDAAAAAKPAKGGGGGGGKTPAPKLSDEDRDSQRQQRLHGRRDRNLSQTSSQVGLSDSSASALRGASTGTATQDAGLRQAGFVGADGLTTDQGRRALSALERGDTRGYQAAAQDATARMDRELAAGQRRAQQSTIASARDAERRQRQIIGPRRPSTRPARIPQDRPRLLNARGKSALRVYKDASGAYRWVAISSTAYRDRDGEIVSVAALKQAVARADATGQRGPLRYWHVPGFDVGDCDFQAVGGPGDRFLIESGTFRSAKIARAVAAAASTQGMTIGFYHPQQQPDAAAVFHDIAIFERSFAPAARVSNLFTQLTTTTGGPMDTAKLKAAEELFGRALLTELLGAVQQTDKAAQDQGVAYKDAGLTAQVTALETQLAALKAAMAAPPAADPAADPAAAPMDPTADDGDGMDDEAAEQDTFVGDLTVAELEDILAGALSKALAGQMGGIADKMTALDGELKAIGYARQKEAGTATDQAAAIAELTNQVSAAQAKLKELLGEQPRSAFRASLDATTLLTDPARLKTVLEQDAPGADPLDSLIDRALPRTAA